MALYRRNKWVMPASTTLADWAPGCAERALYPHGTEPNEILSMSQQEDVLAWDQVWIVQKVFGTETHVRFIIKEQNVSHKTKSVHDARAETY